MAEKEINITYETLFELLRREKTRKELQKLDSEFFQDVINYITEKKNAFDLLKDKTDLFAAEEKLKAEKQLQNTKKIIKELYERREKKIISIAIDSSKTFSTVIDTSAMLNEEKTFFESVLNILNRFRKELLFSILEAQQPNITEEKEEVKEEKKTGAAQLPAEEKKEEITEEQKKEISMIRFLHPVPKFVGKNLEEYGPFDKDDVANIPSELAELLVNKGRAEILE
jgi:DNA replication initiation complex subunit (GINS family)